MASYREIVTKAVIGKAKKTSSNNFTLTPEELPNTILGCWVINHAFNGVKNGGSTVDVNCSFDVNVWYSYDKDKKTAVSTKRFNYSDQLNVPIRDGESSKDISEVIVRCLKQPTVSNVKIENDNVLLDIEKEMGVEIVGDTKVKISVEEDDDDYDEIIDEENLDSAVDNLDDNYLSEEN